MYNNLSFSIMLLEILLKISEIVCIPKESNLNIQNIMGLLQNTRRNISRNSTDFLILYNTIIAAQCLLYSFGFINFNNVFLLINAYNNKNYTG
jgi:hypothetical protein